MTVLEENVEGRGNLNGDNEREDDSAILTVVWEYR